MPPLNAIQALAATRAAYARELAQGKPDSLRRTRREIAYRQAKYRVSQARTLQSQ